ncbi:MAG: hypothetical protein DWQ37_09700 [Planctomycetota bacterium]|nr:MAG: hypothetical protein DWQ37_09700 [Planctomycetota bacterium]
MKPLARAALLLGALPASLAAAQAPTLSHLVPAGIQPGQTVDVLFQGKDLVGPTGLWSTLPVESELTPGIEGNGTKADNVTYRLTLPPDVPPQVAGIRLATGKGVSNVRLILVDDLPAQTKAGNNKSIETAQAVSLPMAIDGHCDGESSDLYKFSAAAGQRVSVEVFARRLGSPLDPAIRLLDAEGRELEYSDDEPSTGADGRFVHTFETAGDYFVEIRDVRYQGGGAHRYRLRFGDFPLVTVPYPLAIQKGTTANVQLVGPSVELPSPVSVSVPADYADARMSVAASYGPGQGSSWVDVVVSDVVEQLEAEPNDTAEQSTKVNLAGALDGRLDAAGDDDYYEFAAKKGQRFVFSGQARSAGSPCDLFMRLYNADGGVVAQAEDNGNQEGSINYTFPADGVYRLRVEETNRRGGPDMVYRVRIEPYQPGFDLVAEAEKVDAPQNGVFVVKVIANRRDYGGPITLSVEGAGEGCSLSSNVIPESKPETTMHVTLGPSLTAGQIGTVKIIGQAKVGEVDFRDEASTLAALRGSLSGLPFPPTALDGTLGLGVGPVFPRYFALTAPEPNVSLASAGAKAAVKVALSRSHGFKDQVTVSADGLPAGVTATPVAIEKDKGEAALELAAAGAIPPGKHTIKLIGSASFQNQPQTFVLETVTIDGPPVAVAFAPAGPVPVGGTQKGTLTFAGDVSPVAAAANYAGGVTRGAEGPRAGALPGFEADNRAVEFSGIDKSPGDDRLTADLPTSSTGDYSLEMWVYNTRDLSQPNSPGISGYLFSRPGTPSAANAQPGDHVGIGGVESSPRDKLFFYDGTTLVPGRTTLALNTWHHVAVVRSGDQVRVYLDGDVANPEIQATVPKSYATNQVVLGTRADGFAPFKGRLDEVAFFDAALAPEQVQAHHAAAKAESPVRDVILKDKPLAYWRLDETEGQVAASVAPAHKRLVKLAWKNLPAGLSAPGEIVLVDGQPQAEIQLAAADSAAPGKQQNVVVAGTTHAAGGNFTAESPAIALEVNKP